MKSITALLMLMILLTSYTSTAQTKDDYLTKSKHQKTAAWVMLGGGWGLGIVGGIVGLHGLVDLGTGEVNKAGNNIGTGGLLILTGGAAILGSIPLFIAAGKNKRKGMSLSFTNQPAAALVNNITGNKYVPSVSLQFKF